MEITGTTDRTGTEIAFKPDGEIFDDLVFDYDTLLTRLREEAFLNAGLKITPVSYTHLPKRYGG